MTLLFFGAHQVEFTGEALGREVQVWQKGQPSEKNKRGYCYCQVAVAPLVPSTGEAGADGSD